MILNQINIENHQAIIIDDIFSNEDYKSALDESKYIINYAIDPISSGSALNKSTGEILKQNKAVFFESIFKTPLRTASGIALSKVLYDDNFWQSLYSNSDPIYSYLRACEIDSILLSYYDHEGHYKPHIDRCIFTLLTWLYEEPKSFRGGDLILRDRNNKVCAEIECKSNRGVLFPSYILHEVTTIEMDEENKNKGKGRYTLSAFMLMHPESAAKRSIRENYDSR
jgi:hypothetical protein